MNWTERIEMYLREGRPVSGGKGDHSSAEQAAADQQRAMEDQMMQQQLSMQQQQMSAVNQAVNPIIAAGGMSPQQQAALTAQVMNNIPAQFQSVQGNINNQLVARGMTGGMNAGSGGVASGFGQLGAMEAGLQQQGLTNIQTQKYQQLMQALGMKMGIGGQYGQNIGTFNSGASSALNSGVTAANNADQASTGLWGSVIGAAAGLGGQAMKTWGCWIAEAIYGVDDIRTMLVRAWLNGAFRQHWYGRLVMRFYLRYGERIAVSVRKYAWLRALLKPLFDLALHKACELCQMA